MKTPLLIKITRSETVDFFRASRIYMYRDVFLGVRIWNEKKQTTFEKIRYNTLLILTLPYSEDILEGSFLLLWFWSRCIPVSVGEKKPWSTVRSGKYTRIVTWKKTQDQCNDTVHNVNTRSKKKLAVSIISWQEGPGYSTILLPLNYECQYFG